MTLTEQIFAHALMMIRDCEADQEALLRALCRAAEVRWI